MIDAAFFLAASIKCKTKISCPNGPTYDILEDFLVARMDLLTTLFKHLEGRGTTTITTTIITITKVFFGRPQGVWERVFPVGNSFLLRGTEKKTQTLNVVWEIEMAICLDSA